MSFRASWSRVVVGLSLWLLMTAGTASATLVRATATSFTGAPLEVSLEVDDAAVAGSLVITLEITGPGSTVGDLRGFFAQVTDESLLADLTVTGPNVTGWSLLPNAVTQVGGGNNLNGGGSPCPCDLGIEFGTPGLGSDDLRRVSFTLTHASRSLDVSFLMGQSFGVRATSVGEVDCRNDSSKLAGVVPEPGTALLIGLGLAGLSGSKSRLHRR